MLCLVGSAPSSGSTFFADLLDSSEYTVCNPELELFCNKNLYDFEQFKRKPVWNAGISTIKATGTYLNQKHLKAFGMNSKDDLFEMILTQESFSEFADHFSNFQLNFRSKSKEGIVFEKTPQNIACIAPFLNSYPKGHFIYLVRNPLFVLDSLLKRQMGRMISYSNWLINVAHLIPFLNHERVHVIKYEDLIDKPFQITSQLFTKIKTDLNVTEKSLEEGYTTNEFRKNQVKKLESWSVTSFGEVKNANQKEISSEVMNLFLGSLHSQIHPDYASFYNIKCLSMVEAIQALGYASSIEELTQPTRTGLSSVSLDQMDFKKLGMKWARECYRNRKWISPHFFFKPVVPIIN